MIRTPLPSDPAIPPGETDGVTGSLYMCADPWASAAYSLWVPKGLIPVFVDPARMAVQLVASMGFEPIKIGSAPSVTPGSVGLIGLPTWLWVQDPSATTYGPNRKSATQNGITITAVGRVDKLVWTMGNGDALTCRGPGTPYAESFGFSPSPDCGYRYSEPGEYDITATAWWTVSWTASTGESGSVPLRVGSRGHLVIGEVQVINR
jgi:hypothetical protein